MKKYLNLVDKNGAEFGMPNTNSALLLENSQLVAIWKYSTGGLY